MAIKAIIFDLGGIILNLNYIATSNAFKALGASNYDHLYSQGHQDELFDKLEIGQISASEFRIGLMQKMGLFLTDEQFDRAWNAMLLNICKEKICLLESFKKRRYKLFLYSNINAIHYEAVKNIYQRDVGIDRINACFDKQYYSHLFGMRKPNPGSFKRLCSEISKNHNITISECLFIDDTIRHVDGARQAGLEAIHVNTNIAYNELQDLIDDKLLVTA